MLYKDYRREKVLRYLDSLKYGWRKFPPSLQIGLTDHCFNRCVMCGHWKRENKSIMDLPILLSFLSAAKEMGLETVCYSGGDPFAYPVNGLIRLIEHHQKLGISYGFITSGFCNSDLVQHLKSAEFVRVSLDSVDAEMYKDSRGGVALDKVMESIGEMLWSEVNVGFGITAHRINVAGIEDVLRYAIKTGVSEVRVWPCREVPDLVMTANQTRRLSGVLSKYADILDLTNVSNNLKETAYSLVSGERVGLSFDQCYACLYQLFIHPNADVYPCCITAGDTQDTSHCDPLFNIKMLSETELLSNSDTADLFAIYWNRIMDYHSIKIANLPAICRRNCIPRLSTINHFAGKEMNRKLFL